MQWIAVETLVGTVRLRIQIVPDPPFIRTEANYLLFFKSSVTHLILGNVTFTLMGVPKIEASAIPMAKALPNILDLPLISGFVQSSIAAACAVYCAPQSMTVGTAPVLQRWRDEPDFASFADQCRAFSNLLHILLCAHTSPQGSNPLRRRSEEGYVHTPEVEWPA